MIRITKIPLKVVDIFKKALNDTTITHLSQGSGVRLKRLMRGKCAKKSRMAVQAPYPAYKSSFNRRPDKRQRHPAYKSRFNRRPDKRQRHPAYKKQL
ncbi:MAG: hypothetical protein ACRC2A_01250 [Enterobacterales bacterium]